MGSGLITGAVVAVAFAVFLAPAVARAESSDAAPARAAETRASFADVLSGPMVPMFSPGGVLSYAPNEKRWGSGVEVSAGGVQTDLPFVFAGLVYRGQTFGTGHGFARYTVALELGFGLLGLEAGYAWRERRPDEQGIHLAPFLPLAGFGGIGPQFLVPADGAPVRVELVASLKLGPLFHLLFSDKPVTGHHLVIGKRSGASTTDDSGFH